MTVSYGLSESGWEDKGIWFFAAMFNALVIVAKLKAVADDLDTVR
jgi:hypothetical protein